MLGERSPVIGPREGGTLEYTDQQRAAFKDSYAKRLRKQFIMIVLLFGLMTALALTKDRATYFGLPATVLGPIALLAVFVGWVIFASVMCSAHQSNGAAGRGRNWRNTMLVEAQVTINGSKAAIWAAITSIEDASQTISGYQVRR